MLAQTTTVNLPAWLAGIALFLTLTATVAAAYAVARQSAVKSSLDTITLANAELRKSNDDLRQAHAAEVAHFRAELSEEKQKRAELEGRLAVFVDEFAERIIAAVSESWRRTHTMEDHS